MLKIMPPSEQGWLRENHVQVSKVEINQFTERLKSEQSRAAQKDEAFKKFTDSPYEFV